MSDVNFTGSGPDETILPDPDPDMVSALERAASQAEVRPVVERHPSDPLAWAAYADATRDEGEPAISVYAYYRVGYHRGLDLLRKNGWKGSGYVRSRHPSNQGFLRCVKGLGDMAAEIGEMDEAERCRQFLRQLDP